MPAGAQTVANSPSNHVTFMPRVGLTGSLYCDKADNLCESAFPGPGNEVDNDTQNFNTANQRWDIIALDICGGSDKVTTSGGGCPFESGSGLNTQYNNKTIFELQNQSYTNYCDVILTSTNFANLQPCGHAGTDYVLDGFGFVNVAASNCSSNCVGQYLTSDNGDNNPSFAGGFSGDSSRWTGSS